MTQCESILAALQRGETVTPASAYALCGTLACHSRIAELRERGHDIECELVKTESGKTVGSYKLKGQLSLLSKEAA